MKSLPKIPKICFFVKQGEVTNDDKLAAMALGVPVVFRNADAIVNDSEQFDGVIGEIPEAYAEYPLANVVLAEYKELLAEAAESLDALVDRAPAKQQAAIDAAKAAEEAEKAKVAAVVPNGNAAAGWKANN